MAKIKLKFGANEIEIDSRDFYLDNKTVGGVIGDLSRHMNENTARMVHEKPAGQPDGGADYGSLDSLEEAEVFEPEFAGPQRIELGQIRPKLRILETGRFFDSPRTVTETVQQLRDVGWNASPLDVSKTLAKMAAAGEISRDSGEDRTCYSARAALLAG